jgi:hypothetical protein
MAKLPNAPLHYSLPGSEKARIWIQLAPADDETRQRLARNIAGQLARTRVVRLSRALTPSSEWEDAGLPLARVFT